MIQFHQFTSCCPRVGHNYWLLISTHTHPTYSPVIFVWCCSYEWNAGAFIIFFFNAETVVTDVALVMGFLLQRGEYLPYFLKVTAVNLSIINLWLNRKMIWQCIFLTYIYLLLICMLFFGLFVGFLFLWSVNRTRVDCFWHLNSVYREQIIILNHQTNFQAVLLI